MTLFHICPTCYESNPVDLYENGRLWTEVPSANEEYSASVVVHIDYYCPHCKTYIYETLN